MKPVARQFFFSLSRKEKKLVWFPQRAVWCVYFIDFYLICIHFLCTDVINLSYGEDDHILQSKKKKKKKAEEEQEGEQEEAVSEPSGAHTNDALNQPDAEGRVLVNFNHPAGEKDIFLAPQLARVVKPHQVASMTHKANNAGRRSVSYSSLTLYFPRNSAFPQVGGIRFLYDNLVESLERFGSSSGFGCILAHSMGLGKTLQVISFIDVLFRHTQAHTVLAIVPVSKRPNAAAAGEQERIR